MKLNLVANGEEQKLILAYLEENASEILAEKINKGVPIVKDGKHLISKKTLDGFMKFATDEARKLAAKGARSACVRSDTVFGWAIHFFEEDAIEGTLYNADGSEYNAAPKAVTKPAPAPAPKKKENPQMSLFGFLDTANTAPMPEVEDEEEPDEDDAEEVEVEGEELNDEDELDEEPQPQVADFYQHYRQLEKKYSDSIVFYRLGDFYEIFGANAVKISDELNLTLTGRNVGLPERVPMTGLPYHVVDIYIAKLLERGYKVVKVDSIGESVLERPRTPEMVVDEETGEVLTETQQDGSDELDEDIPTVTRIMGEIDRQTPTLGKKADDIRRASEILQTIENLPEDEDEPYELDTSAFSSEAVALLLDRLGNEIDVR